MESVGIKVAATPFEHVLIFGMCRIVDGLQEPLIHANSADVLGWAGSLPCHHTGSRANPPKRDLKIKGRLVDRNMFVLGHSKTLAKMSRDFAPGRKDQIAKGSTSSSRTRTHPKHPAVVAPFLGTGVEGEAPRRRRIARFDPNPPAGDVKHGVNIKHADARLM